MAKRNLEDIERTLKEQEKRTKQLKAERTKLLDAERAKLNVEILEEIKKWGETLPTPLKPEEIPDYLRHLASQNRERANQPYQQADNTEHAWGKIVKRIRLKWKHADILQRN